MDDLATAVDDMISTSFSQNKNKKYTSTCFLEDNKR